MVEGATLRWRHSAGTIGVINSGRVVGNLMTYVIALLLIGLSGVLLDMHRRSWRAVQADTSVNDRDLRFARSQYRRRTQSSGTIGVLGAAIGIGPLIPTKSLPMALYVAALGGSCVAIILLAAIDVWASRQNYARLQNEQLTAQIGMARELKQRMEETGGGGQGRSRGNLS